MAAETITPKKLVLPPTKSTSKDTAIPKQISVNITAPIKAVKSPTESSQSIPQVTAKYGFG
jgi:hypothetical protein